jgi:hypothetical protein
LNSLLRLGEVVILPPISRPTRDVAEVEQEADYEEDSGPHDLTGEDGEVG